MIQNVYNYPNSAPYFGSKFEEQAVKKLKSYTSPHLRNCVDSICERIQSWGSDDFIISIEQTADNLERLVIKKQNNESEKVGLCLPRKSNELLHSLIMISKKMITSAESYLEKNNQLH